MCGWKVSVDDTRGCHGNSKSDPTRQHSRSYLGPAVKRWTLREVSMYWGSQLSEDHRSGSSLRNLLYSVSARAVSSSSNSAKTTLIRSSAELAGILSPDTLRTACSILALSVSMGVSPIMMPVRISHSFIWSQQQDAPPSRRTGRGCTSQLVYH